MNIKRFTAPTAREALAKARMAFGEGTLILSNRPTAGGVEVVATAEDDHARAELLAFSAEVPAEAWQELSLSTGETVAGRLRFAPAAPVRLALWRKPR